ncbi:MAG: hypothetical protein AAF531_11090 [Actinomycetota bacterium]
MTGASYTAWDDKEYVWPPPDGWYQAVDGKWWPDGYGPPQPADADAAADVVGDPSNNGVDGTAGTGAAAGAATGARDGLTAEFDGFGEAAEAATDGLRDRFGEAAGAAAGFGDDKRPGFDGFGAAADGPREGFDGFGDSAGLNESAADGAAGAVRDGFAPTGDQTAVPGGPTIDAPMADGAGVGGAGVGVDAETASSGFPTDSFAVDGGGAGGPAPGAGYDPLPGADRDPVPGTNRDPVPGSDRDPAVDQDPMPVADSSSSRGADLDPAAVDRDPAAGVDRDPAAPADLDPAGDGPASATPDETAGLGPAPALDAPAFDGPPPADGVPRQDPVSFDELAAAAPGISPGGPAGSYGADPDHRAMLTADPGGSSRGLLFAVLGVVALVAVGAFLFFALGGDGDPDGSTDEAVTTGPGSVNEPHPRVTGVVVFYPDGGAEQRWIIEVLEPVRDASADTAGADEGQMLAATRIRVTNDGGTDGAGLGDLSFNLVDASNTLVIRTENACPPGVDDFAYDAAVAIEDSVEGQVCWAIPAGDLAGLKLGIESSKVQGRVHILLQ